jgi:formylglycine-generating enzyme required for sulfatase activity/predicted Ser/Thr protein kinase
MTMETPAETNPTQLCSGCGQETVPSDEWLGMCPDCWGKAGLLVAEAMGRETAALHIEGFQIARRIARGGMGTVYEALSGADGKQVALKIIREDLADQPRFRDLFLREGQALAQLDHPHIVKNLGTGEADGVPYLIMDFIDGPNLQQVLSGGPVSVLRALEIAAQVCAALASAHAAGILHRDIKPANVLLDETGAVKVTDFGLARLPRPEGELSFSGSMVALGGFYAAPELARRDADCDARADIYSTGALLYHLIAGEAPRSGGPRLHEWRPGAGVTLGLQRLIDRAMQPVPARRFNSAEQMRIEILKVRKFILAWPFFAQRRVQQMLMAAVGVIFLCSGLLLWQYEAALSEKEAVAAKLALEKAAQQAVDERLAVIPAGWVPEKHENTLGMRFVSIPDLPDVMVSVWELRVADFKAFSREISNRTWIAESGFQWPLSFGFHHLKDGNFREMKGSWLKPGFPQTEQHPVCGVSLHEAYAFCTWLTWKERSSGAISADQAYRVITDAEWSAAAGLKPEPGKSPEEKAATWKVRMHPFPWGHLWPAPDDLFNIVDNSVQDADWNPGWIFKPRRDPWPRTARVDAVPPSPLGLYHMIGNVAEMTETRFTLDPKNTLYAIRGGSWFDGSREGVSLATRAVDSGEMRITKRGFRLVFVKQGGAGWRYGAH